MRILVIILFLLTGNVYAQYSECTDPNGIDWLNLPLFRGVGYGEITDSSTTFTISGQTFTNDNSGFVGAGGGGFGTGSALLIDNSSNITIEFCVFKDTYNLGIYANGSNNITIRNCVFINLSWGTLFESCGNNMKAYNNVFIGMYGQKITLSQGPYRGQSIYMVGTVGSGIEIYGNSILGPTGETFSEDIISTHTSAGTSGSHILIHDNIIWGGGPGTNGVGIIAGDGTSEYVDIYDNRIGQFAIFAIGVAGGSFINVHDNMAFSDRTIWSGGPYYAYANPSPCDNITYDDNQNWVWGKHNVFNDNYFDGSCTSSSIEAPTSLGANRDAAYANFIAGLPAGFPNSIVDFLICPGVMWQLRSTKYRSADIVAHGNRTGNGGDAPDEVDLTRPTANAGADQPSVTTSTASLDGTATVSTQPTGLTGAGVNTIASVLWVTESGPNNPTITSPTLIDTDVTGLVTGTYVFRVVVTQNLTWNNAVITTGQADISYYSDHSDLVTITVNTDSDPPYPAGRKIPVKVAP